MKKIVIKYFSENKIVICEKIAGLQSWNFSDLKSACLKVLVHVKYYRSKTCLMKVNDIGTQKWPNNDLAPFWSQ